MIPGGGTRHVVGLADWDASRPRGSNTGFVFKGRAEAHVVARLNAIGFGTAPPLSVTIADAALAGGRAGTSELAFTLSLSAPPGEAVTLPPRDGMAQADEPAAIEPLRFGREESLRRPRPRGGGPQEFSAPSPP